jgi:hypothetical protein
MRIRLFAQEIDLVPHSAGILVLTLIFICRAMRGKYHAVDEYAPRWITSHFLN